MIREQIAETIKNEAYCGYEGKLLGRRDAANAILTLLCAEIEKSLLTNGEIGCARFQAGCGRGYACSDFTTEEVAQRTAKAQLQKILSKLKEGQ